MAICVTLEGHADQRGSVEHNQALSERRVDPTQRFLVELGVPAANIQTKVVRQTTKPHRVHVKDAVERNPELSAEDRREDAQHRGNDYPGQQLPCGLHSE
jgi:OmpA family